MNWKLKARMQNIVSLLPSGLGNDLYYHTQRHFGGLRKTDPRSRLQAGVDIIARVAEQNLSIVDKTFLEVGTGHQINLPIALWLCGAGQVTTVDLNPYLKAELVFEDIVYICTHRQEIEKIFGKHAEESIFQERLLTLERMTGSNLAQLLDAMSIRYLAPANATSLSLPLQSIDYHVSYTVLEHIPPEILIQVMLEGKRVLRSSGLFIHCVDFSDHFSHSDKSISPINFLQFSENEWEKISGNRYMYQNRLRVDEFMALLENADIEVISLDTCIDPKARKQLEEGMFPLDKRFQDKTTEVNATSHAWIVARPRWDRNGSVVHE